MTSQYTSDTSLIIPGYNGVMDLVLTHIPRHLHRETIAMHMKDIENYKMEQAERPEKMRYEYVMLRAESIMNNTLKMTQKAAKEREKLWQDQYQNKIK